MKGGDTRWTGQGCHGAPWSRDTGCCAIGDRRFADCAGGLTACGCEGPGWQRWDGSVVLSMGGGGQGRGFLPSFPCDWLTLAFGYFILRASFKRPYLLGCRALSYKAFWGLGFWPQRCHGGPRM